MAYIVTRLCIDCMSTECVDVCPVDCFYKPTSPGGDLPNMLYISPNECIDCAACEPACPWEAIFQDIGFPRLLQADRRSTSAATTSGTSSRSRPYENKANPGPDEVTANKKKWGNGLGTVAVPRPLAGCAAYNADDFRRRRAVASVFALRVPRKLDRRANRGISDPTPRSTSSPRGWWDPVMKRLPESRAEGRVGLELAHEIHVVEPHDRTPVNELKLTVVIPAYNEIYTIREVIRRVLARPEVTEIVVVDDGSTDGTRECLRGTSRPRTLRTQKCRCGSS